jgi:hypothetical protein
MTYLEEAEAETGKWSTPHKTKIAVQIRAYFKKYPEIARKHNHVESVIRIHDRMETQSYPMSEDGVRVALKDLGFE